MPITKPQTEATDKTSTPPVGIGPSQHPDKQGGSTTALTSRFPSAANSTGSAPNRARVASLMQRSVGNARLSRMIGENETPKREKEPERISPRIQPLAVSSPNDPSEHEAESVARSVVAGRKAPPISAMPSETSSLSRQGTSEGADTSTAANAIANKGAGSPINPATRGAIEPRMGADLSAARVHKDSTANEAASSIKARAFTHGNDIFLGRGESENDTHLMAHEATHVVQQSGGSGGTVNRAAKSKTAAKAVELAPGVLELKGNGNFPPEAGIEQCLEEHKGKPVEVKTRFGKIAEGKLSVTKTGKNKYHAKPQALPLSHQLFKQGGDLIAKLEPSLIVEIKGTAIEGFVGFANMAGLSSKYLSDSPELFGLAGFDFSKLPTLTNNLKGGVLNVGLKDAKIQLGAVFGGEFSFEVVDEKVSFHGVAHVSVKGLEKGELELQGEGDKPITAKATVALESGKVFKNFSGSIEVLWDGRAVTGEGKVKYAGEKLSGEVTVHLMEKSKAEALEEEKKPPEEGAKTKKGGAPDQPETKHKKGEHIDYAVFGEGDLAFAFNDWLNGTAHVIVDSKGFVTIIGEITPQAEFNLFGDPPQKEWIKQLFKLEARATYGIPLLADIFIFANVSLDAFAKLGPAKFYKIVAKGNYSTDPKKNKEFSIQGSINISAAAGVRLRAEAGAGLEVLGHDIKAGAGINGIAGVKAYAEATPVLGYREKGEPGDDKKGEFYIRGDLEIAAQPFLGLSGDLFVELETPWWSPISDHKWIWPLFNKEYPIGGSIGMLASVDYVFGSKQWPSIDLKPVEFDGEKFMTDMYNDNAKPKSAEAGDQKGNWKEKNEGAKEPPKEAGDKSNLQPGKAAALPTAKSKMSPGGPKGPHKEVDDHATMKDGKKVKDHKKDAIEKDKKGAPKDSKKTAGTNKKKDQTAKDTKEKDPKKKDTEDKLKQGLAALDQVTAHYAMTGATKEELVTGVKSVRRKYFKSIDIVDDGEFWDYEYVYNPKEKKKGPKKKKEVPTRRYLPADFDVRAKLYERGSTPGWKTRREEIYTQETAKIKKRIESILEDQKAGEETRAANRVRALVKEEKLPEEAEALIAMHKLTPDYVTKDVRYHVDHITPLAEHWKTTGYDSGDNSRWNKTINPANLRLITEEANLKKGGEGHHYVDRPYVGKNFVSTYAEGGKKGAKTLDGQPFIKEESK